jgi:hypothetical protein
LAFATHFRPRIREDPARAESIISILTLPLIAHFQHGAAIRTDDKLETS